ncbi:Endoglucanase-4 [Arthrobotrys entomopaga]|nr:Endoglucanase-4 [Arthrobotrys entomopaga]
MKVITILGFASFGPCVMAHGFIYEYLIGGKSYAGFNVYNAAKYSGKTAYSWTIPPGGRNLDGPTLLREGPDALVCKPGAKMAPQSALAAAGSKITFRWNQWPPTHRGPIITWLGDCRGDCSTVNPARLKYFKIDQAGLVGGRGDKWATDVMIEPGNSWTVKTPRNIKNGRYILRHELISLESASDKQGGGTQFYPICSNIRVTGATGQSNPSGFAIQQIPGPPVNPSLGVVSPFQINNGRNNRGRKALYPNPDTDPYATVYGS